MYLGAEAARQNHRGMVRERTRRSRWPFALVTVLAAAALGRAQPDAQDIPAESGDPGEVVGEYMEKLGLKRLQAEDLSLRLRTAIGQQRVMLAERLAKLYVGLLAEARTPADRRQWEDRSNDLLRLVPEADPVELRLSLAKTLHLQATETLERHRLRMATPEEIAEAERVLRSIEPQLTEIAQRTNRRVQALEAQVEKGDTTEKVADDLSEAIRIRSQAFYYLGWTQYYFAMVTGSDEAAFEALKSFGWLLNSPDGRIPSISRLLPGYLKYEHIARSAAGAALATGLRGDHLGALAWLDAIEEADGVAEGVLINLPTWRISVLASSKRWADLERYVRMVRNAERSGGGPSVERLGVVPARLLAVCTLEADRSIAAEVIDPLAAIAMGDLVAAGQISHVLDLVQRYGTAPIGEKGFIVNYVRAIQQYEQARAAHKSAAGSAPSASEEAGATPSESPTTDPDAVEAYRLAASLFQSAVGETDAESFRVERAKASQLWGFCLYYSGDLAGAAERFSATAAMAGTPEQSEQAMWLAVLALDGAVEKGDKSLEKKRDEAAALYLQAHPDSPNAPKLLIRRAMTGALDPEEAIRILMGVEKDSPMYGAARQHASRLLYQLFRGSRGPDRDFAAMRFVGVAEESLNADRRIAVDPDNPDAAQAAQRIVSRVRQILDALLGSQNPDPARAQTALDTLTSVAADHKLDISDLQPELTFRRFQIAVSKDDPAAAAIVEELQQGGGGQFATAADQLMYRRALARHQQSAPNQRSEEAMREVLRYGGRLIERMGDDPATMKDNVVLSLYQVVAGVASELWKERSDASARDMAIRLDTALLKAQPRNQGALRRLALNAESAGDPARALECWRTLLAGLKAGTDEWYEARYESLRLLAATDARRAREALAQHIVLYPDDAPEPWGSKLKQLEEQLGKGTPGADGDGGVK